MIQIIAIVGDNAANNDKMFDVLASRSTSGADYTTLQVRCMGHILNLVAKSALQFIDPEIEALRETVIKIRLSPVKMADLNQYQIDNGDEPMALIRDVKTRWGSTYDMLGRASLMKEVRNLV